VNIAHACKRHLQDTTMFVYHHAVQRFLGSILDKDRFGEVKSIDTCFYINSEEARSHGILNPSTDVCQGYLGDLCRYCAVLGLLVFQRSGHDPISAQVTAKEVDDRGQPIHIRCLVKFEGVSQLIDCDLVSNTADI